VNKRPSSTKDFIVFLLIGTIVVAVIFALGDNVLNLRVMKSTFNDPTLGISFQYPADFRARETKSQDISFIDVYPAFNEGFEPKFIEIVIAKDNEANVNLSDQIALALKETGSSRMTRLHNGPHEGIQFTRSTGTDRSIYTYYKANGNLMMVKLNQQFYDVANPLILINNSSYTGMYYSLLNSLQIYTAKEAG